MAVLLPTGSIAWWPNSKPVPFGWTLCNGLGGAPDLRDRFIVGAGNIYAIGATGGTADHTHTNGTLSLTSSPGLKPKVQTFFFGIWVTVASHVHFSPGFTGATASSGTLPPYHALLPIMKT